MAVTLRTIATHQYIGLSSDTKPTAASPFLHTAPPIGSTFLEHDTGVLCITHDGTLWVVKDNTQGLTSQNQIATATSAALANTLAPAARFRLIRIELTINTAGTTAEDFTLDLDAGDGSEYDVNILTQSTKTPAITSLIVPYGEGYEYEADDEIDAAWPNTENRTYGLRWVYELIQEQYDYHKWKNQ